MARGTGFLFTDEHMYFHDEFNRDMYRNGYGEDFILTLDKTTPASFANIITEWNKTHHDYSNFKTYKKRLDYPGDNYIKVKNNIIQINFNIDYFNWWLSDWIFIKNASNKDIHVITRSDIDKVAGRTIIIKKNEVYAFCFGRALSPEDIYTASDVKNNPITNLNER